MNVHSAKTRKSPRKKPQHPHTLSSQEIQTLVCQTDLLRRLDRATCDALLATGRVQRAAAKTFLFNQGDEANICYVLLSGEIRLLMLTPDGKRVIIDIIGPGVHLGFFVALAGKQYPLSAEIIEDCQLYAWDAARMREFVLETPHLTMNIISALTERVTCLQTKIQQLATENVEHRIAHSLLMLSRHLGKKEEDGILIDMPLTHRDLAEMSGTNIYSVSRVLHQWEIEGIITTGRKRVLLRSPERLPCHS